MTRADYMPKSKKHNVMTQLRIVICDVTNGIYTKHLRLLIDISNGKKMQYTSLI